MTWFQPATAVRRSNSCRARGARSLPDLVVLDLMMPLVDGHQVLDTMKSDPVLASIPVVVLSAVARERPVGAAAFLRKPIPLQKFFDTIKGFVEAGLPRARPRVVLIGNAASKARRLPTRSVRIGRGYFAACAVIVA